MKKKNNLPIINLTRTFEPNQKSFEEGFRLLYYYLAKMYLKEVYDIHL